MVALFPRTALPYLAGTAAAIACFPTAIGVGVLLRTQTVFDIVEWPPLSSQATAQDRNLLDGFVLLFGARDLAIGLSMLTLWYNLCRGGNTTGYQTLGVTTLIAAGMVVIDGLVSRKVIGGGELKHWGFLPVQIALGLGLLEVI